MEGNPELLFEDDSDWRSKIQEIWYYTSVEEDTFKILIDQFDVNSGQIVLYAPDFDNNRISISRGQIPQITEEHSGFVVVVEVIASGYENAYVVLEPV